MGGYDFRLAGHLPKLSRTPADPYELPRQRRGRTPQMHGRYPDFDCLSQAPHWDALTRSLVLSRLEPAGPLRFFSAPEARTLEAFCDAVLAQDSEPRIPVLAFVDAKLAQGKLDGYRYQGMPDDRLTWRLVARGLDESARLVGAGSYAEAPVERRDALMDAFAEGTLSGGVWETLETTRAWQVVSRSILAAFYSHPWAWNEIGFAGPAYPRGYARLGRGLSEAWEGKEAAGADPGRETAGRSR
jgi:hypothetical protein